MEFPKANLYGRVTFLAEGVFILGSLKAADLSVDARVMTMMKALASKSCVLL